MTFAEINKSRIAQLHPLLQAKATEFVKQCKAAGIEVLITQALRTIAEQNALWQKGRDKAGRKIGPTVTNAKGGQSYHNYGLAFDFVPLTAMGKANWNSSDPAWAKCGKIGQSLGLEWGGAWTRFKDMPHFQLVGGITIKECQALNAKGGLPLIWQELKKRYA